MKILKGSITTLASEGRITLQVTQYNIIVRDERAIAYDASQSNPEDVIDAPDEWFTTLRGGQRRPVIGKEQGYTFLSRIGWEANKEQIKKAFKNSEYPRGTWLDFEIHVEKHFHEVIKATKKKIIYEEKRLKALKEVLKKI